MIENRLGRFQHYPPIMGIGEKPYAIKYGYYHGYTLMDKESVTPAYPFGYGLSYTTFELSERTVQESEDAFTVSVRVKNTGSRDGAEYKRHRFFEGRPGL